MYIFRDKAYTSISSDTRGCVSILTVKNTHCQAELSLFGAHLLSYVPRSDSRERLWLSPNALFDKSKPIRGGIPICWPWFADIYPEHHVSDNTSFPAHGFVRTQDWQVESITEDRDASRITLKPTQLSLYGFSEHLSVLVEFTFAEQCTVKLMTQNGGQESYKVTSALHTYFKVDDIRQTEISGISGEYVDKTETNASQALKTQDSPYLIERETDRIHRHDQTKPLQSINIINRISQNHETTNTQLAGHDSIVVWNPWKEKTTSMPDMDNQGFLSMLCIEAAITRGIVLEPNTQHELVQVIS